VQHGGEEKTDAHLANTGSHLIRWHTQVNAQGLEYIGAAAMRGDGAVAMLGHRNAGCGHHKAGGGRDVETARTIAAGTDDVHQHLTGGGIDAGVDKGGFFTHHLDRTDDLIDGLAFHAQPGDERSNLSSGRLTAHDLLHHPDHFRFAQVLKGDNLGDRFSNHGSTSSSHKKIMGGCEAGVHTQAGENYAAGYCPARS